MAVGPQILVLLSLTLQVALLFLAGIRRRGDPKPLKLLLWLVYQLADPTAIYAIGHLSLCDTPREHRLVAFWAAFLLLHLGGPDNISAYALQDSQLWLRHLTTLVTQVSGAAYILYKHIVVTGSDLFLRLAGILMFAAGLVKYAERNWALKCSKFDSIRSSLNKENGNSRQGSPMKESLQHVHPLDPGSMEKGTDQDEKYLRQAHFLFHISRRALVDSSVNSSLDENSIKMLQDLRNKGWRGWWILMEMELSLIYDFLYTKAAMIYTWRGYCIRLISLLVTAASLLLFQISEKEGQSRVDIAVTYTLLVGAFIMETTSLFAALGSTWTYAFLCTTGWSWIRYKALCTGRWDQLRRLVKKIKGRGGGKRTSRRWSGKMGQYNMLHYCSRQDRAFVPLLGMLAKILRRKDWWKKMYYSGSVYISDPLRYTLYTHINLLTRNGVNTQGMIRKSWGQEALEQFGEHFFNLYVKPFTQQFGMNDGRQYGEQYYNYFKQYNYLGVEFQEGIIIWHVSTDVFLAKSIRNDHGSQEDLVKAIRTLSNYMMFLLVDRPYMLPGLPQIMLYRRTCDHLIDLWKWQNCQNFSHQWDNVPDYPNENSIYCRLKEFFLWRDGPMFDGRMHRDKLAIIAWEQGRGYGDDGPRLYYANRVANELLSKEARIGTENTLLLLLFVWIDFLVYAANRCGTDSHAKKLSSGGELTTVVWIMLHCLHQEANIPTEDVSTCTIC